MVFRYGHDDPTFTDQQTVNRLRERLVKASLQCHHGDNFRRECAACESQGLSVRQSWLIVHGPILIILGVSVGERKFRSEKHAAQTLNCLKCKHTFLLNHHFSDIFFGLSIHNLDVHIQEHPL
jgi:hypothetical protein